LPIKTSYAFVFSPMLVTLLSHSILTDLFFCISLQTPQQIKIFFFSEFKLSF
jgi:hypothetical protein